jgi:hypothetical protein
MKASTISDTPSPINLTLSVPRHILQLEADLSNRFLGIDLKEICESAADSRCPVLISTAGLPLKNRNEALRVWRADMVRETLENSEAAKAFMQDGPEEFVAAVLAGDIPLNEWRDAIEKHIVGGREKEVAGRRGLKAVLRGILRSLIFDLEEKHPDTVEPRWLVITTSRKQEFFRYERRAKQWGNNTGEGYMLLAFDPGRSRIKPPVLGWAAGMDAAPLDDDLVHKPAFGMSSEEIEDMEDDGSNKEKEDAAEDTAEGAAGE